jgi:protein-arginine kinase activator protein McsA
MGWNSSKSFVPDQIDHEVETIQKTITLEDEIKEAIVTRDFEKAAVVQKEIDILRKGKVK